MPVPVRMILAALLIMLPLAACSSQGSGLPPLGPGANTDEANYKLGPGDKLHIAVVGADDLTGDYAVGDNGAIGMALIGDVQAKGLTRAQVEKAISDKLAQGYIKNPKVSVSVLTYRPFYIYGEVQKPGEYSYASGMRVMSAVATAGGYTYRANQNFAVVTRNGQEKRAAPDTPIEPDDIIKVPERYF